MPLILASLIVASAAGYRGDGTGTFHPAAVPTLDTDARCWTTPMEGWSNAGPVLFGDMVCTTSEPTEVVCVDRASGAVRWRASSDYAETLQAEQQSELHELVRRADAAEATLIELQRAYSAARRDVRRDPTKAAEMERLAAELAAAKKLLDDVAPYRTPADKEVIGYASATPVTDGTTLFAAFGNGVVSAFDRAGTRRWSVWMGTPPEEMNGYHMGVTASPLLVDGALIVSNGRLAALDPATGKELWSKGPYLDYAPPAVLNAGDTAWLILPSGTALRARDAHVGASGLGVVWFVSPVVIEDRVYFLGGEGTAQLRDRGHMAVAAWRLQARGSSLEKTRLWSNRLHARDAQYSAPVFHDGRFHMLDSTGLMRTLDATNGQMLSQILLSDAMQLGPVYSPLVIANDALFVHGEQGGLGRLSTGPQPVLQAQQKVGPSRSGATFDDAGHMYVRTTEALLCLDP